MTVPTDSSLFQDILLELMVSNETLGKIETKLTVDGKSELAEEESAKNAMWDMSADIAGVTNQILRDINGWLIKIRLEMFNLQDRLDLIYGQIKYGNERSEAAAVGALGEKKQEETAPAKDLNVTDTAEPKKADSNGWVKKLLLVGALVTGFVAGLVAEFAKIYTNIVKGVSGTFMKLYEAHLAPIIESTGKIFTKVGTKFMEMVDHIGEAFLGSIETITLYANKIVEPIVKGFKGAVEFSKTVGSKFSEVTKIFKEIGTGATDLYNDLRNGWGALTDFTKVFKDIFGIATKEIGFFGRMIGRITDFFKSFSGFGEVLSKIFNIGKGLGKTLGKIAEPLMGIFAVVDGFLDFLKDFKAGNAIEGIKKGVATVFDDLFGWIFDFGAWILKWIAKAFGADALAKALGNFSAKKVFSMIFDPIVDGMAMLGDAIGDLLVRWINGGPKQIIADIFSPITDAFNSISEIVSDVADSFKALFTGGDFLTPLKKALDVFLDVPKKFVAGLLSMLPGFITKLLPKEILTWAGLEPEEDSKKAPAKGTTATSNDVDFSGDDGLKNRDSSGTAQFTDDDDLRGNRIVSASVNTGATMQATQAQTNALNAASAPIVVGGGSAGSGGGSNITNNSPSVTYIDSGHTSRTDMEMVPQF